MKNNIRRWSVTFGVTLPILLSGATPLLASESYGEETPAITTTSTDQDGVTERIPEMEKRYLDYGLKAPVEGDFKRNASRASIGGWTWRDGVICVTTEGFGTDSFNTWHAAIVAPQYNEVVVEAPKAGSTVRFRSGMWQSTTHTIWQVGVRSTTEAQDWNAGNWAGAQVGKPYNLNFWNARQTDSFYCSQLVWAAYYYTCGVDLNKSDNDIGSAIAIHPGEFVENSNTAIIYRNR